MKIGAYPFASTGDIHENLRLIERGIDRAAMAGVRLLAFHECALCGYPPIETDVSAISPQETDSALSHVAGLAKSHNMHVLLGTVRFQDGERYNSAILLTATGERIDCYDKQALWGWDTENFRRGESPGIFQLDGFKLGVRICFDVRFPEPFRELYRAGADACIVLFSDTQPEPSPGRYATIKGHLLTRAMENLMPVVSVNSLSGCPTAPTAVFDRNGGVVTEAELGREQLMTYELERKPLTFGEEGRRVNNAYFIGGN